MSRHDDRVSLRQMLEHSREAVDMGAGRTRADLDSDRQLNLSLTRLVEVVGEAASRVSNEMRSAHPGIPWQEIIHMRNRLIHAYDLVDLNVLWDVVDLDLPPLIQQLERIIGK